MKLRWSWFIKGTMLLSFLTIIVLTKPDLCLASQSGNELVGITNLKKDTAYKYDLNGDGKTEKIKYKVNINEEKFSASIKLYVNDKLIMSRKTQGFYYSLNLCDIDKRDGYIDIYCFATMESGCINDAFFVRYDGEKLINMVKFPPKSESKDFNTIRFSIEKTAGDCTFIACVDTPVFSNTIGCYYCYVPYQLKNNKIARLSEKTYLLTDDSKKYQYKVKKGFSVYDKAGSKTIAFKVKKGEKVTFDQIYLTKSNKAYFRIVNHKGKKGWIKSDQEGLFYNLPMWG